MSTEGNKQNGIFMCKNPVPDSIPFKNTDCDTSEKRRTLNNNNFQILFLITIVLLIALQGMSFIAMQNITSSMKNECGTKLKRMEHEFRNLKNNISELQVYVIKDLNNDNYDQNKKEKVLGQRRFSVHSQPKEIHILPQGYEEKSNVYSMKATTKGSEYQKEVSQTEENNFTSTPLDTTVQSSRTRHRRETKIETYDPTSVSRKRRNGDVAFSDHQFDLVFTGQESDSSLSYRPHHNGMKSSSFLGSRVSRVTHPWLQLTTFSDIPVSILKK